MAMAILILERKKPTAHKATNLKGIYTNFTVCFNRNRASYMLYDHNWFNHGLGKQLQPTTSVTGSKGNSFEFPSFCNLCVALNKHLQSCTSLAIGNEHSQQV